MNTTSGLVSETATAPTDPLNRVVNYVPGLKSTVNPIAPIGAQFFGDPALRLSTVVNAAYTSSTLSLCETDYTPAVDDLAQKIIARLK